MSPTHTLRPAVGTARDAAAFADLFEVASHGIGSQLLADIESQARSCDSIRLALGVDVSREHAIAVYEHQGWRIVGTSTPTSSLFDRTQVHRMTKSL